LLPSRGRADRSRSSSSAQSGRTIQIHPERLYDRYNRDFACVPADKPELLKRAYRVRYQAYCLDNQFEDPAEHPDQLETDRFDMQSAHCILNFRPTGDTIGTVRLVQSREGAPSFSVKLLRDYYGSDVPVPLRQTAEVSRFCISKSLRSGKKPTTLGLFSGQSGSRRVEPLMSLGLIQGLVRLSALHGMTHWCAVMEPQLLRMLAAMGIQFIPVGAMIEYHGLRQLCYCEVETILGAVQKTHPSFWEILTDAGALCLPRREA
jgi:N-acyl amino acid synthase of PEP-CTERM/exosortase system